MLFECMDYIDLGVLNSGRGNRIVNYFTPYLSFVISLFKNDIVTM